MEKWLWVKGNAYSFRQLISEDHGGFELIKFEYCIDRKPSMVREKYLTNLLSLQLLDMENLSEVDLSSMDNVRSIIIHNCRELQQIEGMEKLSSLAWLQICGVKPSVKLPSLSCSLALKHLEIDIPNCAERGRDGKSIRQEGDHSRIYLDLGDLTCCIFLKEICVRSPFLSKFPTVKGLRHLEKVEFIDCFDVTGPLDCTGCSQLQKIVLNFCCQMAHLPLLSGCSKISEIVLWQCDALAECPQIDWLSCLETLELCISSEAGEGNPLILHLDSCSRLKNIQLWNMKKLMKLPKFNDLFRLTALKLHQCGIYEPPDLAGCPSLENVSFFTLKKLKRFPSFSGLTALRKLSLCDCKRVRAPPDISGCSQLQVFHFVYNDNMQGLPQMDNFHRLEEIKLSWHAQEQDESIHMESDSDSEADEYDDLEFCLNVWKDKTVGLDYVTLPATLKECVWLQGKRMLPKMYFRGGNLHYSIAAPYDIVPMHQRHDSHSSCMDLIRMIRRVDEMKWGRKWGYDVKLSEAGLHAPVLQIFDGSNQGDCSGMEGKKKGKELWLQMWREWESNQGVRIVRERREWDRARVDVAREICIKRYIRAKVMYSRNKREEKTKVWGNEWTEIANNTIRVCDDKNYWNKKWEKRFIKAYGEREWMEMESDRLIWEKNFMNKISIIKKTSTCLVCNGNGYSFGW